MYLLVKLLLCSFAKQQLQHNISHTLVHWTSTKQHNLYDLIGHGFSRKNNTVGYNYGVQYISKITYLRLVAQFLVTALLATLGHSDISPQPMNTSRYIHFNSHYNFTTGWTQRHHLVPNKQSLQRM